MVGLNEYAVRSVYTPPIMSQTRITRIGRRNLVNPPKLKIHISTNSIPTSEKT